MEKKIVLEKTKNNPGMYYDPDMPGFVIEGRSIPENPESVYLPLRIWIEEYFRSSPELRMEITLEYINSGSSKQLLEVLKILKKYNENGKPVSIIWFYEEDDEAIMELGEQYRDNAKIPMKIEMIVE